MSIWISSSAGEKGRCWKQGGPSGGLDLAQVSLKRKDLPRSSSVWCRCRPILAAVLLTAVTAFLLSCGEETGKEELNRRLLHAVIEGNTGEAKQLLEQGADIDAHDQQGMTALHLAVENDHSVTLEFLLRSGADVNSRDVHGWTPLHLATFLNDTRHMNILLDGGADLFIRDEDGRTPLDIAALYQRKEAAVLLLKRGGMVPVEVPPGSVLREGASHLLRGVF